MAKIPLNWNVTVFERHMKIVDGKEVLANGAKQLFTKRCLSVKEANDLLKLKQEEYPDKIKYSVLREQF